MSSFFDNVLLKQQCDFQKSYNTQQCHLALFENWKRAADSSKMFGALLKDHSKAFYCLEHGLLIAKHKTNGFSLSSFKLV